MEKIDLNKVAELLRSMGAKVELPNNEGYWRDKLDLNKSNLPTMSSNNLGIAFENADEFAGWTLKFNDFTRRIEINGHQISNVDWAVIRNNFERVLKQRNKDAIKDFVIEYADNNKYNPIQDYIRGLKWDGKKRLETMFIDWFKVDDNQIIRKQTVKWMVSAIKRIFEPGCEIEGMIVLNGQQGIGKSVFIKRLANGFDIEAAFDIKDEKKCAESCLGAWIVNFEEMKSFYKVDPDAAKAFLTRTKDSCRLAYREEPDDYARHCVFIGSTNDSSILKDYTGNIERRYWIMKSKQTDKKYIFNNFKQDIVNQLWAEAYNIYVNNKDFNISITDFTKDEEEQMLKEQRKFKTYADDDLVDGLNEILNDSYELQKDGTFKNLNDCKNQIINKDEYKVNGRINRIPFSYLNMIISTMFKTNRPNKWLAAALEDEWVEIIKGKYGINRLHILVRKSSIIADDLMKELNLD